MVKLRRFLVSLLILEVVFAIHEYGHLIEFQKINVPVEEFSLGIGPAVYQYDKGDYKISLRLIPFMAYVSPGSSGHRLFQEHPVMDRAKVHFAGIKNNAICGLAALWILQIIGWRRGNVSLDQLFFTILMTPIKIVLRLFAFVIGVLSWNNISVHHKFLLSTGGIDPWEPIKKFVILNLVFVYLNLLPCFPMLDGTKLIAVLFFHGGEQAILDLPLYVSFPLFCAIYWGVDKQDTRILEIQEEEK